MSHFTVLVIGDDFDEQLQPYNENTEVYPYKAYWDSHTIETNCRILEVGTELSFEAIAEAWNKRYAEGDDAEPRARFDEGGIFEMSTYNPKSRWDWYEVGGRWRGFFKLKPRSEQERWHESHDDAVMKGDDLDVAVEKADNFADSAPVAVLGRPGVGGNEPRFDADITRKGDVDIEGMRAIAGEAAGKSWDLAQSIFGDLPEAKPWTDVLASYTPTEGEITRELADKAREVYHAQPRVKAVEEHDRAARQKDDWESVLLGFMGPGVEIYQGSRDEFVQEARDNALTPYAYVKDGEWNAPGKMGWFGMSSDDGLSRRQFTQEFNAMLDALPDETILTLCDCHI